MTEGVGVKFELETGGDGGGLKQLVSVLKHGEACLDQDGDLWIRGEDGFVIFCGNKGSPTITFGESLAEGYTLARMVRRVEIQAFPARESAENGDDV